MPAFPIPMTPTTIRVRPRTAVIASADGSVRQRLHEILTGLRWQVCEATGGADAWSKAEETAPEAMIVDAWLPDLHCTEFVKEFEASFPGTSLLCTDGAFSGKDGQGSHRQELLYALRRSQEVDVPDGIDSSVPALSCPEALAHSPLKAGGIADPSHFPEPESCAEKGPLPAATTERLPELVGEADCMLEVSRRIRLVAPRPTAVLIEGPTGSGKELVAAAIHRLSKRSRKAFVALNCAAIPEALLEAELFGHTRGAFTGAIQGRVGRIESADGGTLFLDEIGEMPLALQAKLLRFVESGELQRVGDNETLKVDVRVIAATHRPLAQHTQTGAFRADLYYRLAVFLIRTPALGEHLEDLPALVAHFLDRLGRTMPMKRIDAAAFARLHAHPWPGNVRELEHVLERAAILAGDAPVVTAREIDFGGLT
ncbi:MAG TPA: sigma-54 dependent transcriptional regulator [Terracidiphilus sp.]